MANKDEKTIFKPQKMVSWFHPLELGRTAIQALISQIFAEYADKREMQAGFAPDDLSQVEMLINAAPHIEATATVKPTDRGIIKTTKKEIYVDFIADLGDGFEATFTMAKLLAKENILYNEEVLPRADVLLMGGDMVYPAANKKQYYNRFIAPYQCAFPKNETQPKNEKPILLAIPGNHDWYDGLTNYMKIFCQQRSIGNWRTMQTRSYFALQLIHNVWVWGIDIQLNTDIDKPQLDYFERVVSRLKGSETTKIILLTATPSWVIKGENKEEESHEVLQFFIKKMITAHNLKLLAVLTGDLHHYAHYEQVMKKEDVLLRSVHYITAGGGGAFLHPTHHLQSSFSVANDLEEAEEIYTQKDVFPSVSDSKKLLIKNLFFIYYNPAFMVFMGLSYAFFEWLMPNNCLQSIVNFVYRSSTANFYEAVNCVFSYSKGAVVFGILIVAMLTRFTDIVKSKYYKIAGFMHGIVQVLAMLFVSSVVVNKVLPALFPSIETHTIVYPISRILGVFVIGGVLGSTLMGVYLLLSNWGLGNHDNEAFSAIKNGDYKNFLRLKITENKLVIYPIKVLKTLKWTDKGGGVGIGERFVATNGNLEEVLVQGGKKIEIEY